MDPRNKKLASETLIYVLWAGLFTGLLGLLFFRVVFPDLLWITVILSVIVLGVLGGLIQQSREALKSRAMTFGLNSFVIALLVILIVGVFNFLSFRYPQKLDLTKNKLHTLSDQTVKIIKELKQPIKAVYFSKTNQREKARALLDNLKGLNPKFEVEYVDPDKEPARAKQATIRKYETLQLIVTHSSKERPNPPTDLKTMSTGLPNQSIRDQKIEDISEEKITNAIIKLLKEKQQILCAITGHGERNFNSNDPEGYEAIKKALGNQYYDVKEVNLIQEAKIPESCDAIAIMGPTKSFFDQEIKILQDYLEKGGRAVIGLDINIKGGEYAPELTPLLSSWFIKPTSALIVDPLSRMFGVDASVPILKNYSKDHAITRDFQVESIFPFARPLEILPGAPANLNLQWVAQTLPTSWGETDFQELLTGQVKKTDGKDKGGPLTTVVAVEGKKQESNQKKTRLVVFGTSQFANNNYSRFAGNMDFFLNSVSWIMEDENMISIRPKEEGAGKVELSMKAGRSIFLATVVFMPLFIAGGGIGFWVYRRRL